MFLSFNRCASGQQSQTNLCFARDVTKHIMFTASSLHLSMCQRVLLCVQNMPAVIAVEPMFLEVVLVLGGFCPIQCVMHVEGYL
jgi:hypothetical protein